ncbi:MAG: glutamine synthetase, partial [Candidatus Saccharicenans sp.]|nr:glutamine synthetase [Candidatus Saccharicenans sp.]
QESAAILREKRYLYERDHVFPQSIIEYVINLLENENDRDLSQRLAAMSDEERKREMRRIMHRDLHRH